MIPSGLSMMFKSLGFDPAAVMSDIRQAGDLLKGWTRQTDARLKSLEESNRQLNLKIDYLIQRVPKETFEQWQIRQQQLQVSKAS